MASPAMLTATGFQSKTLLFFPAECLDVWRHGLEDHLKQGTDNISLTSKHYPLVRPPVKIFPFCTTPLVHTTTTTIQMAERNDIVGITFSKISFPADER